MTFLLYTSFVLFLIIIAMTLIQRWVLADRDEPRALRKRREGAGEPGAAADATAHVQAAPTGGGAP